MFKHTLTFSILFTLHTLAGCAASGPAYTPAPSAGGYGYSEQQLAADRYAIQFVAREGQTSTARELALLRAAELTLQKGHQWFEVADRSTDVDSQQARASVSAGIERPITRTHTQCGLLTCSSHTRVEPGFNGYLNDDPDRPAKVTLSVEIVMGSGRQPHGAAYYDAAQLADNLRDRMQDA